MQKFLTLAPVGGTTFNQLADGSIRVYVNPTNASRFRLAVLRLAEELNTYMIQQVELAKNEELIKREVPPSRIQQLEAELARLKAEPPATQTADSGFPDVNALVFGAGNTAPVTPPTEEEKARTIVSGGFEAAEF